jgi:hypothetical protein
MTKEKEQRDRAKKEKARMKRERRGTEKHREFERIREKPEETPPAS